MKLNVVRIIEGTSVDGPGLRTSVYIAGCRHGCPRCHNPQTWSFTAGHEMSIDSILEIIDNCGFNVTLTGGDPFFNVKSVLPLAQAIKHRGYNIWCYTGFTYEEIITSSEMRPLLDFIDVLVDGPFIADLADLSLPFRGSSNQRIIDCNLSGADRIVILDNY